jgi:predicted RNA-binding Zn-ribbon protein involved in translation (DUF1610 family)
MNNRSFYRLDCWSCSHTIELPTRDGVCKCPNCGAVLLLQWTSARAEERPPA